jgi:hypothetical protein
MGKWLIMDKKILEEIERIKLISGYSLKSTLTENKDILLEKTALKVVSAVDPAVVKGLKNVMHDTPGFLATLKNINFAQFGGITRMDGTVLKNSDEIFKALKSGKLTTQNAGKVYRNVFRSTTDPATLKAIAESTVLNSSFIRKYGVLTKSVFIERTMKQMKIGQKQAEALWNANRLLNKGAKNVGQGAKVGGQGVKVGGKTGGNVIVNVNTNIKNMSKSEIRYAKQLEEYSETLWRSTGQNADELARNNGFKNFDDWGRRDPGGLAIFARSETRSGTGFFGRLFSKGRRWATVWSIAKWGALALGAYWLYKNLFGDDAVDPCDPGTHMVEGKGCIPDEDPVVPPEPDPVVTVTTTVKGGGGESYIECDEPYYKGCIGKKGDDTIKKAQDCLGVTPNGFFNQETEDALKNKINKKSFTSSDMSAICASSYGGGSFQI